MWMPKVSVIMGVYNEKNRQQLELAIDSILSQTLQEWEFFICDDGSEQSCYQMLQEICGKDERIRLLRHEKNQGLAAALNTCLSQAKGSYIARMDGDDISKPERLQRQWEYLEKHPDFAMAGCEAELMDEQGIWGVRHLISCPEKEDFLFGSPFIHPTVMVRREVLEKLGGYCTGDFALRTEDYELFMRMYEMGFRGYNMPEILFSYREDRNSYTRRKYRYRIREYQVRKRGFARLGIARGNRKYIIKPLLVGLLPGWLMKCYKRKRYGKLEKQK